MFSCLDLCLGRHKSVGASRLSRFIAVGAFIAMIVGVGASLVATVFADNHSGHFCRKSADNITALLNAGAALAGVFVRELGFKRVESSPDGGAVHFLLHR